MDKGSILNDFKYLTPEEFKEKHPYVKVCDADGNPCTQPSYHKYYINIHSLTLPGDSEFARKFNYVSRLYEKCKDLEFNSKEGRGIWDAYYHAKYCLEQGI